MVVGSAVMAIDGLRALSMLPQRQKKLIYSKENTNS